MRRTARAFVTERITSFLTGRNIVMVNYGAHPSRADALRSFETIRAERQFVLRPSEACQLISVLQATQRIPGDIAEVGVAYGASAKLITQYAGDRTVHLFDTFGGLPAPQAVDNEYQMQFRVGDYACSLADVTAYINSAQCRFYPGLFPETAGPVADQRFSFVHLDVDLYESTKAGLEFFYPRMSRAESSSAMTFRLRVESYMPSGSFSRTNPNL